MFLGQCIFKLYNTVLYFKLSVVISLSGKSNVFADCVFLQTEKEFQVSKFLSLLEEEGGLEMREFCKSSQFTSALCLSSYCFISSMLSASFTFVMHIHFRASSI